MLKKTIIMEKPSHFMTKISRIVLILFAIIVFFCYGVNATLFAILGYMIIRSFFFVVKLNLRNKIRAIIQDDLNPYVLTYKHLVKHKKTLFWVIVILLIDCICEIVRSQILLNFIKFLENVNYIVIACTIYTILGIVKKVLSEYQSRYQRTLNIMITSSIKKYVMERLTNQAYDNIHRKKSELHRLMREARSVPQTITYMSMNMIQSSLSILVNVGNYYLINTFAANFVLVSSIMFYWYYGWNAVENYTKASNKRSKVTSKFRKTHGREMELIDEGARDQDCYSLESETDRLINKSKDFDLKLVKERKNSLMFYLYQNLFSDCQWLVIIISYLIQSFQSVSDTKERYIGMMNLIMITNNNLMTISWLLMEYSRLVEVISEWAPLKEFIQKNYQERIYHAHHIVDGDFNKLEIKQLKLTLPREKKDPIIIQNKEDLIIESGDRIMFIGESGEGKSSFSKALASYFPENNVDQEIILNGKKVEHGCYGLVPNVVIVNQDISLNFDDTIKNIIKMGTDEKEDFVTVNELITICMLHDLDWNAEETEKRENTLSGGQKTRLKLAYSLNKILYHFRKNKTNPMILILDEIDSGLKKGKMIVDIQKNIMKLKEFENTAIISIVHNPDCVEKLYKKCWVVENRTVFVRK
uniref:ABC transporter n=1 Tax=Mimivirus LCMiAC01 TaxID=2506608 RepID=A0A481Z1H4_9VIRU|nr:MAG: ABC transporter [Mimivirus LCMiAC01]